MPRRKELKGAVGAIPVPLALGSWNKLALPSRGGAGGSAPRSFDRRLLALLTFAFPPALLMNSVTDHKQFVQKVRLSTPCGEPLH